MNFSRWLSSQRNLVGVGCLISGLILVFWPAPLLSTDSPLLPEAQLADGTRYVANQLLVVNRYGVPPIPCGDTTLAGAVVHDPAVARLCNRFGVVRIEPFYPGVLNQPNLRREIGRIYIFTLAPEVDPQAILPALLAEPDVACAGLRYLPELFYEPNDPRHTDQWYLAHTRTYEAWDTVRGEVTRNAIVGIVDTGINWEHPDLATNIWINTAEDINQNGIFDPGDLNDLDEDDNGFADDVVGWDFGDADPDPVEDDLQHGTGVAGCASEATDNGLLGAGIGFAARLMAVKTFTSSGQFTHAYQGLVYAVDNGAQVVNCSWGTLQDNPVEQLIIEALWAADAVIVASAGSYNGVPMYPAAYGHVLAVTATDALDHKASFANFGHWVDIAAPGVNIWTVKGQDDFSVFSGTSFACALVSGLAALIRAWGPDLTNSDTVHLIETAAVDIDDLNPSFAGMLGAGRIDCAAWLPTTVDDGSLTNEMVSIWQNRPNPFNAVTVIAYEVLFPGDVLLEIFDLAGQRITTLVSGYHPRGRYAATWNATGLASGVYCYEMTTAGLTARRKCLLVK